MKKRYATGLILCLSLLILTPALARSDVSLTAARWPAHQVTEAEAFHRAGQTFLTWPEMAGGGLITYRVYRQSTPFEGGAPAGEMIVEVPQESAAFWTDRARLLLGSETSLYPGLRNYVITDLGPELADGTGLLVWTAHEAGDAYYLIVPTVNGAENFDAAMAVGPVAETVDDPLPVLIWQSGDGNARVYTQFMDLSTYNASYDAPNPFNYWLAIEELSESPMTPYFMQYAYNYFVGLPTEEVCEGPVPDVLPLVLDIEGWGTRYEIWPGAPWFCAVSVMGDDPNQSWYYGFSATHDYRQYEQPVTTGPIVNYTEERLLRTIYDVLRDPAMPAMDPQRVYVYGQSMGGTGALALAERYPQVFAAANASQPMINYAAAEMWVEELEAKWGARALNLPVESRGPFAGHLAQYDGTGVWDWQALGRQLSERRGDDMAFIWISHGTMDTVIDWATVAQPSYTHFYEGNRAFAARIDDSDHTWSGFVEEPFGGLPMFTMLRDESLPAFANASGSMPIPPTEPGGYNLSLEWSASWYDFAGPPVDTPEQWAVVIRSMDAPQTVDVTPRRLQAFVITPGASYAWRNESVADGAVVASGTVVADEDGLVTVTDFAVDTEGNRLVIEPEG